VRRIPKQLIMRFQINDGKDGEVRTFTRRLRAVDQFYSIAEWYFRAWDKRSFEAKLSLVEGTEIDLLVHTIDLHDHFTYLARRGAKKAATLYPEKQRRADRHAADPAKTEKIASQQPLTPEEQTRWDRAAWNTMPPMNSQFLNGWGAMPAPDKEELKVAQSEGAVDRGWGVYLPTSQTFWAPLAGANDRAKRDFINSVWPMQGGKRAAADAESYYLYNDRKAARRAAFKLVRIAQVLPTWNNRQALVHSVADYRHTFKQETSCRKRTMVNYAPGIRIKNVRVYDLLFDFIQGNEELAFAVSQFLPDIRTSEDLVRFLDTNILQYTADLIVRYRMKSDHETPLKMLETAVVQADPEVTRPWMDYLFTRTYDYPMPLSGIQDYMNTSTTRDGTTWIGSWFYSAGGGRSIQTAELLKRYLAFGGDPKYDLTNFSEYPKILSSCYWALEGRVAGMYPMQIGDVNGPTVDFAHWFDKGEQAIRQGWRWTKDPRFAFFLKHYWGRKGESEDEWNQILKSAKGQRHPWFANRSRALSQWAGVLEAGTHHEDFRFRRAVTVRVGNGHGHAHNDTLDLNIFAHGCVMAPDSGQRPAYGIPASFMTFVHNVVEVDGDGSLRSGGNWNGHAWIRSLTDSPGAQFLLAESTPPYSHQQVKLFHRSVALIDVDEGKVSEEPVTPAHQKHRAKLPADVITPHSYVFDVFRVAGGKIHTYCFHGGQNDEFTHNIEATSPLDESSRKYLRKFSLLPESKWVGKGREQISATWRLSREKREIPFDVDAYLKQLGGYGRNIKSPYLSKAAEQGNLAASYDPAAPRKFTTVHLIGEQDARVMKATWGSPVSKNHFDQLFVQRRIDDGELESAFAAVIEPYAGQPAVESLQNLSIDGNENDSRRAVAVQVNVKDDERVKRSARKDVCFSDGRPEKVRKVGEFKLSGQFSFVSEGPDGLRQMTLVGGRVLSAPGISMELSRRAYTAKIESIDYRAGTGALDTPLPTALLDDGFFEVGNEQHRTSLHVVSVKGRRFSFRKSPEIVTTRVISVDAQRGTVRTKLGMPPAGGKIRGMDSGLTATDETRSQFYRCEFLGGSNAGGFTYRLTGEEVSEKVFPELSALRVYEFGPGDELKMTAFASLRKMDEGDWQLKANVSLKLILEGTSLAVFDSDFKPVDVSMDKKEGEIQVTLDEPMLMRGTLRLRVNK